jgi:hypothetical protein
MDTLAIAKLKSSRSRLGEDNVRYRRCKVMITIHQQRKARIDTVEDEDGSRYEWL